MEQKTKTSTIEQVLASAERRLRRIADDSVQSKDRTTEDQALAVIIALKRMKDRLVEHEQLPLVAEKATDRKVAARKKKRRSSSARRRVKQAA